MARSIYGNVQGITPINKRRLTPKGNWHQIHGLYMWPAIIQFNEVLIINPHNSEPSLIKYSRKHLDDACLFVDLMAYITHAPLFLATSNQKRNEILAELFNTEAYSYNGLFNLSETKELYSIDFSPYGKTELALSLYNTAIKQPEPLARCVFMFRVVEAFYADTLQRNSRKESKDDFVKRIINNAISYKFDLIPTLETNEIAKWKKQAKHILRMWNRDNKSIANQVIHLGRHGSAHGDASKKVLRQEKLEDYRLVERANILLDLSAGYLIESNNPEIKNTLGRKNQKASRRRFLVESYN